MMMVAVCGSSIISLDWLSSAGSFHWAWLIIVLNGFKTRPRHIIFERTDRQSLVFRRFPFIHFAESGNCRSQRAACYHLHIICFCVAALWFTGSCRPITLSLCKSLLFWWQCANHCDTNNSYVERVRPKMNALEEITSHLGRKTLSTT